MLVTGALDVVERYRLQELDTSTIRRDWSSLVALIAPSRRAVYGVILSKESYTREFWRKCSSYSGPKFVDSR